MKTSKKSSKSKVGAKVVRAPAKAKKPSASKIEAAKVVKLARASRSTKATDAAKTPVARRSRSAAASAPAKAGQPPAKPVHEWAEAIKKAALQNKQGHHAWPGAGSPSWKGKQRPE